MIGIMHKLAAIYRYSDFVTALPWHAICKGDAYTSAKRDHHKTFNGQDY